MPETEKPSESPVLAMRNLIRQARQLRGLTQAELAERVGTTAATVSRLEQDAMTVSTEWLARFAAALDMHPSDLLEHRERSALTFLGKAGRSGRVNISSQGEIPFGPPAIDSVAVEITAAQGPYRAGEMLIGERLYGASMMSCVGRDCIVALKSGGHMIARVVGLPPSLTLVPLESGEPVLYSQEVEWIAIIVMRVQSVS